MHTIHLATAADAQVAGQDHPTAKGESGEGGPSIGHTIEAAATPIASQPNPDDGAAVAGHADEDVAQMSADPTSRAVPDSTETDGIASGVVDVDNPVSNGDRLVEASGDEGTTPTRSASGSTTVSSMATGTSTGADDVADLGDVPLAAADEAMSTDSADQTSAVPAKPSDDATSNPAARPSGDGFDSALAASRQEARTVGAASTTSQISAPDLAPTPGPLASAEGSLWDDVRLAFDRIRSSADGQEVRIRLRPAELGDLVVQVRTSGDQVSVRLTASSAAAHQTLVDDRLRLATELAKAGFDEGSVDIGLHDGSGSFGDARHGPDAQDAERGRGTNLDGPVVASTRPVFEEREPFRTHAVFRPGRQAYSTINLTL